MRLANSSWLGLLVVLLLAGGVWFCGRLSADPKPQEKPAEEHSLARFVYPGSESYKDYAKPPLNEDIAKRIGKYTTGDAPEKVIKWYLEKLDVGKDIVAIDGTSWRLNSGTEPYTTRTTVIHDYGHVGREKKDPRPVTVWGATAKLSTKKGETYILTVIVTRGKDEARTHIALTWLPG